MNELVTLTTQEQLLADAGMTVTCEEGFNDLNFQNVLYFITDGVYTKIGIATNNATSRLRQCQTGNPKKLWIDFEIEIEDAKGAEASIHKKYADQRLMGEWFDLSENDINDIKEKIKELYI